VKCSAGRTRRRPPRRRVRPGGATRPARCCSRPRRVRTRTDGPVISSRFASAASCDSGAAKSGGPPAEYSARRNAPGRRSRDELPRTSAARVASGTFRPGRRFARLGAGRLQVHRLRIHRVNAHRLRRFAHRSRGVGQGLSPATHRVVAVKAA
jgi:hypothetical protein